MANPKYKTSRSRTRRRRSHLALTVAGVANCPRCREPKMSHRACANCGYYKNRPVLKVKEPTA